MAFEDFPINALEFDARFRSESACWEYLRSVRYPAGFVCLRCAGSRSYFVIDRGLDECATCGKQQSLTAGTMFHRTRSPLKTWFRAIFEFVSSKSGCSAKHIERTVGISYETAWTWLHKIRDVMTRRDREQLKDMVEADETYVGAPAPGYPGRKCGPNQFVVFGAVEVVGKGCGRTRLSPTPSASGEALIEEIKTSIQGGSTVATDGFGGYEELHKSHKHLPMVLGSPKNASRFQPRIHKVFSLFKRLLLGTYHGSCRRKWAALYCAEFTFRFNRRNSTHRTQLFHRVMQQTVKRTPRIHLLAGKKRLDHVVPVAA